MIVDDHAQVSGHRLRMQGQERPRREVHDPEVIDAIVPALSDKKGVVRYTAAAAVISLSTVAGADSDTKAPSNANVSPLTGRP